jgi:hypothetical protein
MDKLKLHIRGFFEKISDFPKPFSVLRSRMNRDVMQKKAAQAIADQVKSL